MQIKRSTSPSALNIWKPLKKRAKPKTHTVKNSSEIFTKQDSNNVYFNKVLIHTEDEDMAISNVDEVVGTEEEDQEVLFLDQEPQTNGDTTTIIKTNKIRTTTTTTTSTATMHPNNNTRQERQLTLYYPHRWYSTRWETSTVLPQLDKNYVTPLATLSSEGRIQDTISSTTNSMEVETFTPDDRRSIRGRRSCPKVFERTNNRIITIPTYWFPIEFFHHTRDQQTSTYIRLPNDKSLHSMSTFQDGGCSGTSRLDRREGLHLQVGSQGCLCCHSYSPRIEEISNVFTQRQGVSIQDIGFRDECQSSNIQQTNAVRYGAYENARDPTSVLPRRHMHFGEDTDGSSEAHNGRNITFRKPGFCDKQRQEYINTFTTARLSGVYIQFEENDNISSKQEVIQTPIESEPSTEFIEGTIMQVDSQLDRKDDFGHTSNRRSPFAHTIFTTRPIEEFTPKSPTMGSDLHDIDPESTRITMVENMESTEKRFTYSEEINQPRSGNSRRRIQFRMGSNVGSHQHSRFMDTRGTVAIYQRPRAKNNFICSPASHAKISKEGHKNLHRQHHSVKICDEIGRHFISNSSRNCGEHTRTVQLLPTQRKLSTHSRCPKHSSRQTQSPSSTETTSITTLVRSQTYQEDIQPNTTTMGPTNNRCFCQQNEYTTSDILESSSGPSSSTTRCLSANLDQEGDVLIPTVEVHTSCYSHHSPTEDTGSSAHNSILDNTVLVSDANSDAAGESTVDIQTQEMDHGRMAIVKRKKQETLGLEDDDLTFVLQQHRKNTHKVYNNGWKKWAEWCQQQNPQVSPEEYNTDNIFRYLMENRNYSSQYLNGLRSSIASVFKLLHPNHPPIADVDCIKEFFEAKRKSEFIIPTKEKFQTWDLNILTTYIKRTWPAIEHETMSLYDLQLKTVLVMCMTTFGRPRSDVGEIRYQDIHFEYEAGQV
ncbi:hypothetical protein G6F41_012014 [Rhizopus arrhizus]|nr:hypothetical protein G6F41_012014 [Rhizopus arrhizus]